MPVDTQSPELLMKRELEKERLSKLRSAPESAWYADAGVLLSDRVQFYCEHYDLITPFCKDDLRPAGYDLCVGDNYSVAGGEPTRLAPDEYIVIQPYQVAIIQIRETLNLPEFLIGRWNIRVKLAYRGLLWVGGAQVDPGWRGKLCCPIYNLSSEIVRLRHGDPLAAIDFVVTTKFRKNESMRFKWEKKVTIFEDYVGLNSGVADQLKVLSQDILDSKASTQKTLDDVRNRIDNFVSLVFVVVSVLFTGLGIIATKQSTETSILSSPIWVAAIALYFALKAFSASKATEVLPARLNKEPSQQKTELRNFVPHFSSDWLQIGFGLMLALAVVAFHLIQVNIASKELKLAQNRATEAVRKAERYRTESEAHLKDLRFDYDQKFAEAQAQIRALSEKTKAQR